jgi:hypothetical protein
MKRTRWLSFVRWGFWGPILLIALARPAAAQNQASGSRAANPERSEAAIQKIEQEGLEALRRNDTKTLERILGDDWMDNTGWGRIVTRKEFFSRPVPPAPPAGTEMAQHFEDTKVRFYGDVAIATGMVVSETTEKSSGKKTTRRSLYTDVLVWRDGRWQAVSSQETGVPEGTK